MKWKEALEAMKMGKRVKPLNSPVGHRVYIANDRIFCLPIGGEADDYKPSVSEMDGEWEVCYLHENEALSYKLLRMFRKKFKDVPEAGVIQILSLLLDIRKKEVETLIEYYGCVDKGE